MPASVKVVVSAGFAILLSVPACGVNEAAQGEGAQQRIKMKNVANVQPINKPGAKDQFVNAKPGPQIDVEPRKQETPEQRIRRLKNESERDRCLELVKQATGSDRAEYREDACTLKLIKTSGKYIQANLNYADATVVGNSVTFSCRSNRLGDCVNKSDNPIGQPPPKSAGFTLYGNPDKGDLQKCLDFLHNRCKAM